MGGSADTVDVTDADRVAAAFGRLGRTARFLVNNAGPASAGAVAFAQGLVMGVGSMEIVTSAWLATEPPAESALVNVAGVKESVGAATVSE